jgi:hypothetical protein
VPRHDQRVWKDVAQRCERDVVNEHLVIIQRFRRNQHEIIRTVATDCISDVTSRQQTGSRDRIAVHPIYYWNHVHLRLRLLRNARGERSYHFSHARTGDNADALT